jgi:predicted acetyltransferase
MEIYPTGQQSTTSYPNYEEWLSKYWEDTVALSYMVLKPGKRFGFIINNYVSLKKEEYPLIQDLNMVALKYFKLVGVYNLLNRVSPLRMNKKNRTEMLFIYEKL